MVKAVFTVKPSPVYDDLPEKQYHFPRSYLRQVEAARGDWIVYYEPRRPSGDLSSHGGRQAYFATARLDSIEADPVRADHFYAHVSQYLVFDHPVPFAEGGFFYERSLQKADGSTNKGAFGRAVRVLPDAEYDLILAAGFAQALVQSRSLTEMETPVRSTAGFAEPSDIYRFVDEPNTQQRPIVEQLISRPFRDRAFSVAVKAAYGDTCAITGLRIINGGGRSEVQAAHIRPVAQDGPDSVRNGIALSGTVHWMFDRGLLSIGDDYRLLVARDRLPDIVDRLLPPDGLVHLPNRPDLRPHPQFLHFHQKEVFKG